jgi:hypothetical protein
MRRRCLSCAANPIQADWWVTGDPQGFAAAKEIRLEMWALAATEWREVRLMQRQLRKLSGSARSDPLPSTVGAQPEFVHYAGGSGLALPL